MSKVNPEMVRTDWHFQFERTETDEDWPASRPTYPNSSRNYRPDWIALEVSILADGERQVRAGVRGPIVKKDGTLSTLSADERFYPSNPYGTARDTPDWVLGCVRAAEDYIAVASNAPVPS
jgi:hypothetical protein